MAKAVPRTQVSAAPDLYVGSDTRSEEEPEVQTVLAMMNAIPNTIEDLALVASGLQEGSEIPHGNSSDRRDLLEPFGKFVRHLRFPRLHTLDLEGWIPIFHDLRDFLLAHAPTLGTLRLINMYVCIESGNKESVVGFIGDSLALTGIEISRLRYKDTPPDSVVNEDDNHHDNDDEEEDDEGEDDHDEDEPMILVQHITLAQQNPTHTTPSPFESVRHFFEPRENGGAGIERLSENDLYHTPWLRAGPNDPNMRQWPSRRECSSDDDRYPSDEDPEVDEPFIREAEKVELAERKCLRGRKNEIRRRVPPIAKTREERVAPFGLRRAYW